MLSANAVATMVRGLAVVVLLVGAPAAPAADPPLAGFGATTPGGAGQPEELVTNLNDSGVGSLRAALSAGNRTIRFAVGGDIVLTDHLRVKGAFVTIDGATAPAPGITLRDRGLIISGKQGAHDVIVQGLRIRDASEDGIQVSYGAYNVVIDHVSVSGSGDGNLDITGDPDDPTVSTHDVTVSWSILDDPASGKGMLIKYNPARVTLHHNLIVKSLSRNPSASVDDLSTPASDTTLDMRNNVVWDWGPGSGSKIHNGARANVVNNFYSAPNSAEFDQEQALIVCAGNCPNEPNNIARAYVEGNFSNDRLDFDLNIVGTESAAFSSAAVATVDACLAAHDVRAGAGVRPLDAVDTQFVNGVTLPACVPDIYIDTLTAPVSALPGATVAVTDRLENLGTRTAENFVVRIYLSKNTKFDTTDILLSERVVATLPAGRTNLGTSLVTIPLATQGGNYVLIGRADALDAVQESNERNNVKRRTIKVLAADLVVSALTAPSSAARGTVIEVGDTTENRGDAPSIPTQTRRSLRSGAGVETLVGSRAVPALAPRGRSLGSTPVLVPASLAVGTYTVVAKADADGAILEPVETNNTKTRLIKIK